MSWFGLNTILKLAGRREEQPALSANRTEPTKSVVEFLPSIPDEGLVFIRVNTSHLRHQHAMDYLQAIRHGLDEAKARGVKANFIVLPESGGAPIEIGIPVKITK
jgi:hypothetical protein